MIRVHPDTGAIAVVSDSSCSRCGLHLGDRQLEARTLSDDRNEAAREALLQPLAIAAAFGYVIVLGVAERKRRLRGPSWLLAAIPTLAVFLVLIYTTVGRRVPGEGALSALFMHLSHFVLTPAAIVLALFVSWFVSRVLRVPVFAWAAAMALIFATLVFVRRF